MRTQTRLKRQLRGIIDNAPHSLKAAVAREVLNSDDISCFFKDLLSHGCQSGMIGSLIYYSDTHDFYDRFYREIEELRYDLEQSLGETLQPKGDLKNWFAWLGFEETARLLADELQIDW